MPKQARSRAPHVQLPQGFRLIILFFCFFFFLVFFLAAPHSTWDLSTQPGSSLRPLQWKCRILTTGIPKLMICTFKVAQGRMKHSFGNCVHYLCGSSHCPFLSYPVSPPLSHYSSLSLSLSLSVTRVPTTCHQVDPGSPPPLCCWCQAVPRKWILPCQILPPNLHTLSSLSPHCLCCSSFLPLLASELALAPLQKPRGSRDGTGPTSAPHPGS